MFERRDARDERRVRDVYLIDGSVSTRPVPKKPSGVSSPLEGSTELIRLKVQVFYSPKNKDEPDFMKQLLEAQGCQKPFHFYGLTAQFRKNGYITETMSNGRYYITPRTGTRAEVLLRDQQAILAAKNNTTVRTLEKKWDYSEETLIGQQGQETFCAHLADMAEPTSISALDDKAILWQASWVFPID